MVEVANIREAFKYSVSCLCNPNHSYIQFSHVKKRTQLELMSLEISNPLETRKIEGIENRGIAPICTEQEGLDYFKSFLNSDIGDFEYTYGNRIEPQLYKLITSLKKGYSNNVQAWVWLPKDYKLIDKPCLAVVDFKRLPDDLLNMFLFFRSNAIEAMPKNLIALSHLFELVGSETELIVNKMHYVSTGLNCRREMIDWLLKVNKYLVI